MATVYFNGNEYDVPTHPSTLGIVDCVLRNDEVLFVELYEPTAGMQATQFVRPTLVGTTNEDDAVVYTSLIPFRTALVVGGVTYFYWTQESVFTFEPAFVTNQLPTTRNYNALDNPSFKIYKTPVDVGMILEHRVPNYYEQYTPSVVLESQEYHTDYSDDSFSALADRTIAGYDGEFGITAILNTDLDATRPPLYQADVTVQMPICNYESTIVAQS